MSIIERVLIYVVIAAHLSACATRPVPTVSEAQRDRMGAVGVISLASAPQGELVVGTRGTGAGAAQGAAAGAVVGSQVLPYAWFCGVPGAGVICVPVLLLFAGTVTYGAAVGGAQAVPEDKAGEIEATLRAVLAEVMQQAKLRSAVVDAAARAGVRGVTEMPAGTVAVVGQTVDYRQLSDPKVDTVLEVGLVSVGLVGRGGADPALMLRIGAVARLVDARSNAELFRGHAFTHESGPRKFSEWGADGARLLKEDLERAYGSIGRSMVDEIFLVVRTN
jgi:hypothetical protein